MSSSDIVCISYSTIGLEVNHVFIQGRFAAKHEARFDATRAKVVFRFDDLASQRLFERFHPMDANTRFEVHRRTRPPPDREPVVAGGGFVGHGPNADLAHRASTTVEPDTRTVWVVVEGTSNALSRIFLLLATLSLIRVATRSESSSRNTLDARLSFNDVGESRIDQLYRKLFQLTETISVDSTERSFSGSIPERSVMGEG